MATTVHCVVCQEDLVYISGNIDNTDSSDNRGISDNSDIIDNSDHSDTSDNSDISDISGNGDDDNDNPETCGIRTATYILT